MTEDWIAHYQEVARKAWALESPHIASSNDSLRPMLAHHFESTGKLLRPALAIATYDLLMGQIDPPPRSHPAAVLRAALSVELLHNGTLIHDDFQDGDEVRRGLPTVWKAFSPYQAINAGSVLYFHTIHLLSQLDLPAQTVQALIRQTSSDAIEIIAGQAAEKDLLAQLKDDPYETARDKYFEVIRQKTSALFAMPLAMGAILADVPENVKTALQPIARPLGALFQVQDDVLDLYGQKGRDAVGNDLAESKPSFLVIYALEYAPEADAKRLQKLLETPRDESSREEIDWAIAMLRECGALDAALGLMEQLRQQVLQRSRQPPLLPYMPRVIAFFDGLCEKLLAPISHLETF